MSSPDDCESLRQAIVKKLGHRGAKIFFGVSLTTVGKQDAFSLRIPRQSLRLVESDIAKIPKEAGMVIGHGSRDNLRIAGTISGILAAVDFLLEHGHLLLLPATEPKPRVQKKHDPKQLKAL